MIVVCMKWSPTDDVDDERFAGVSPADHAALEIALQLGERLGLDVLALSSGPVGCERALRHAFASGAQHVMRLDLPAATESRDVGAALAQAAGDARVVVCGDHSLDRGSGSVPAYIAHHRHVAQALGLVSIDLAGSTADSVQAVRRLDGGRREVLLVPVPCVLSVESSVASPRRAPLRRAIAADSMEVPARATTAAHRHEIVGPITPFRPRARMLAPPAGTLALDRIRQLTDTDAAPTRGETIDLPPPQAAARIVAALREWGYLL